MESVRKGSVREVGLETEGHAHEFYADGISLDSCNDLLQLRHILKGLFLIGTFPDPIL